MSVLSENLVYLRKNSGFTQDDIATKVFVSRQAVSKWERGETSPDVDTLIVLSELYGVTVDGLLKQNLADQTVPASDKADKEFPELKKLRRKQTAVLMTIWAFSLLGIYALLCGVIQVAFFRQTVNIWLIWFTLPVVPPIVFAVRFHREIGKEWLMFFLDVPFLAGMAYELMVMNEAYDGAWLAFLIIPVYYAIAVIVCIYLIKQKKNNTANRIE